MSNDCLELQETPFSKAILTIFTRKWFRRDKYATCGLRVTLQYHSYHNVPIRLSVLTLTFANGHITEVQTFSSYAVGRSMS